MEGIAISKIADILSDSNLIEPEVNLWKKIFYNSGQNEFYNTNCDDLEYISLEGGILQNNPKCYDALYKVFVSLISKFDDFIILLNEISFKINPYSIFDLNKLDNNLSYIINKNNYKENNNLLRNYSNYEFNNFRRNLNILGLDISFNSDFKNKLVITHYEGMVKQDEKSLICNWLEKDFPNVFHSYKQAIRAYSHGDNEGTLTHCRNVITGIFTYNKENFTKWYTGLQKACKLDKNILNIPNPSAIGCWKNNSTWDSDINKRYNYPRFKTIVQIYSFLSDLGPHINEATLKDSIPDYEVATFKDALFGLRITEDVLIWLYHENY